MKTVAQLASVVLLAIVVVSVFRTIFERQFPYVRAFDEKTRPAFILLIIVAAGLFAWTHFDLRGWHVDSVEIAGVKASVGKLQQKVETLSSQIEVFFKSKRIQVFDEKNWNLVRKVNKSGSGVTLEVTLDQEPIPGSVEVFEGVLLMPEQRYHIDGRRLRFPANSDTAVDGLTIKYYPRVIGTREP